MKDNQMVTKRKYWIDTEFIEYPCTIDLISIGIVDEKDNKLYAINSECNFNKANDWVKKNVLSKLPDKTSALYVNKNILKNIIIEFIGANKPEFWGYYADYDWVAFCWIFGSLIDLPKSWPRYCKEIKQLCDDLGNPKLPEKDMNSHNALFDAMWNKSAWEFLMEQSDTMNKEFLLQLIKDYGEAMSACGAYEEEDQEGMDLEGVLYSQLLDDAHHYFNRIKNCIDTEIK